jgi:hypothetical protein
MGEGTMHKHPVQTAVGAALLLCLAITVEDHSRLDRPTTVAQACEIGAETVDFSNTPSHFACSPQK